MNSVQIIGNLTRDPEVRYTKTGKPVASFTVAVNRSWVSVQGEKRESTDFIPSAAPEPRADYSQFGAQPQAGGNFGNQPGGPVFGGSGNDDDIPF